MRVGLTGFGVRVLTLVVGGCLCSCGPREQELAPPGVNPEDVVLMSNAAEREFAIVNGQAESGHPQVGMLYTTPGGVICTGTLVGSRTVLTAAHCTDEDNSTYWFWLSGKWWAASSAIPHPSYPRGNTTSTPEQAGNDIGLMLLASTPPVQPSPIAAQAPPLGSVVELVGYGITALNNNDMETKRSTTSKISKVGSTYYEFGEAAAGMGTVCSGDSGGPHFLSGMGSDIQVGTNSTSDCTTSARSPRLDQHLDWIRQQSGNDVLVVDLPGSASEKTATSDDAKRPLGAACTSYSECASGTCAHDPASAQAFCSAECTKAVPCPSGYRCVAITTSSTAGVCWPLDA